MLRYIAVIVLCLGKFGAAARLPGAPDVQRIVEAAFKAPPVFPDSYEVRNAVKCRCNGNAFQAAAAGSSHVLLLCCCCPADGIHLLYAVLYAAATGRLKVIL
jgi:hypothetical protein